MYCYSYILAGEGKSFSEDCSLFNDGMSDKGFQSVYYSTLDQVGVADGVGGNAGGRVASYMLFHQMRKIDFTMMDGFMINSFVHELNRALIQFAAQYPNHANMASTMTVILRGLDGYYLVHAGNTRAYAWSDGKLMQLTKDQTTYQHLLDEGKEEEARGCNRNEINCCLGGGNPENAKLLVTEKIFLENMPEQILFTSDGIHEYVTKEEIEEVFSMNASNESKVYRLMDIAVSKGSLDDRTILYLMMDH